jgi:hypothetical protein
MSARGGDAKMILTDDERRTWRAHYGRVEFYPRETSSKIIRLLTALEQAERERDSWKAQYLTAIWTDGDNDCEHGQGD